METRKVNSIRPSLMASRAARLATRTLALRTLVAIVALVLAHAPTSAAGGLSDEFEAVLLSSGCFDGDSKAGDVLDAIVPVAVEWSGLSIKQLREVSRYTDSLDQSTIPDQVARHLTGSKDRLVADLRAVGRALCPLLILQANERVSETEARQLAQRSHYHAYVKAAQIALDMAGCAPGSADGVYGAASRNAWKRAAKASRGRLVEAPAGSPTAIDVARLVNDLSHIGCESGAGLDATPYIVLSAVSRCDDRPAPEPDVEAALTGLLSETLNAAAVSRGMARVWQARCGYENPKPRLVSLLTELLARASNIASTSYGADIFAGAAPQEKTVHAIAMFVAAGSTGDRAAAMFVLQQSGTLRARMFLHSAQQAGLIRDVPPDNAMTRNDLYLAYVDAIDGRRNPAEVLALYVGAWSDASASTADGFIVPDIDGPAEQDDDTEGEGLTRDVPITHGLRPDLVMGKPDLPVLMRFAELVSRFPAAAGGALAKAPPKLKLALAVTLLERWPDETKDALALLADAADEGLSSAQFYLAAAKEFGLGGAPDSLAAVELYKAAAAQGQRAAAFALARIFDDGSGVARDADQARNWYNRAIAEYDADVIVEAIQQRIVEGSVFFSSEEGEALLMRLAKDQPKIAERLGTINACVECGGTVNLEAAARWFRLAAKGQNGSAQYGLARILTIRPDLAETGDEALLWTDGADSGSIRMRLLHWIRDLPAEQSPHAQRAMLARALDEACAEVDMEKDCLRAAHELAIGAIDPRFVQVGFTLLTRLVHESTSIAEADSGMMEISALVDVLAFYGDFEDALRWLPKISYGYYLREPDGFDSRNLILRRLVLNQSMEGQEPNTKLIAFLSALGRLDDDRAQSLLQVLDAREKNLAELALIKAPLEDLEARYATQAARGGLSRGLVGSARSLAVGHFHAGNKEQALRFELTALNTEIALAEADQIWRGSVPSALTAICSLARASRRMSQYEYPDIALVLAKEAVNRLQRVRADIAQLPHDLQLCFSDAVADNYRWLAHLFHAQGNYAEEEFVLGLLKDFEKFEYVDRHMAFEGDSFRPIPFTAEEERLRTAIQRVEAPLTTLYSRKRDLEYKRGHGGLTSQENAELRQVSARLEEKREATVAVLEDIQRARREGAVRADQEVRLRLLGSIAGPIQKEFAGKAVAIHYLVLPDRMNAVLTTSTQVGHTWTTLDGKPFTSAALSAKIADLRNALKTDTSDPLPAARALYDLLLPSDFMMEIAASGADTLLLSLDGDLRFIPFAALNDGKSFLVEKFSVVQITGGGRPSVAVGARPATISALGVSQAVGGFPALPSVPTELDGLVKIDDQDDYGVMPGRVALNDKFDLTSFQDATIFGPSDSSALGIVHVASHFVMGPSEAESFLLLGGGGRLSVAEIKDGLLSNNFDFRDVDLLTLSACDSAYGISGSDGRQLETFAGVVQDQGARDVLASLWPIADDSTAIFMQRFYEINVAGPIRRDVALAKVMREFIANRIGGEQPQGIIRQTVKRGLVQADEAQNYNLLFPRFAHPAHWAPFVLLQGN